LETHLGRASRWRLTLSLGLLALGLGCGDVKKAVDADRKAGLALLTEYESKGRDAAFDDPKVRLLLPPRIRNVDLRDATFRAGTGSTKLEGVVEAMDDKGHWESGPFSLFVRSGSVIAARFPGIDRSLTPPTP
jgi:hypothetical protein